MKSMRGAVLTLIIVLVATVASNASAHAFLDHADPRVGSTVTVSPQEVRVWFTEKLEPAFTTLHVVDSAGKTVDRGDGGVDASDPALLRISLPVLAPGRYRVIWRASSVDGHTTAGDFTFTLGPSP